MGLYAHFWGRWRSHNLDVYFSRHFGKQCLLTLFVDTLLLYILVGRFSFDKAIQLDNNGVVAYVFMADIFGTAGMLEDAKKNQT